MTVEQHDLEIEQSFLADGFRPACSCGWEGRVHDDNEGAVDEWENHCDVVFMEAPGG